MQIVLRAFVDASSAHCRCRWVCCVWIDVKKTNASLANDTLRHMLSAFAANETRYVHDAGREICRRGSPWGNASEADLESLASNLSRQGTTLEGQTAGRFRFNL
jgi:hypothetical protein